MTNSEILKLAIEKAKVNGYINNDNFIDKEMIISYEEISKIIIFDIDFAKAFWGTNTKDAGYTKESNYQKLERIEEWEYHLQQMVLKEEPLKYLEKFL